MAEIQFYELSTAADQDLEDIFDYLDHHYGGRRAEEYLLTLEALFGQLVDYPEMGVSRDKIRTGLRSFPKAQHIVFYRILPNRVRIVRILHQYRDLRRHL
ncbi:type II toxin-antitoxin system RelE/ParE family toxin [Tunicatimonas pelagia]|uniref:type II toxin-antitoxin system RelE/ParE family toxin n=1 Tax=Tunicatimonas pelagia TaxID=931531 RepID=UPI002666EAB9|nr:type II toxin-antitoxin system RelE/ParE family toxin [Tunicatimonas pelagia]WKN44324.1 type II toxin-antitoxin system RelE/ParE family toxin [Tunicatimonas pelagia]